MGRKRAMLLQGCLCLQFDFALHFSLSTILSIYPMSCQDFWALDFGCRFDCQIFHMVLHVAIRQVGYR